MAQISVTPADVRPLNSSIKERFTAGEAGDLGDVVTIMDDGKCDLAESDTLAHATALGIVVAVGTSGDTSFSDGDVITVVTFGRVEGFSGMTEGDLLYVSDTPGEMEDAAPAGSSGEYKFIVGQAVAEDEVLVNPFTDDLAAQ